MVISAYIHIPFCETICSYCDFCKVFYQRELVELYLDSLEKEITSRYQGEELKTIYIGGGTPSCLTVEQLDNLFSTIKKFRFSKDIEFTFECNIDNLTEEKLELLYNNNVNRLSIGIQTFENRFLQYLGRNHTEDQVKQKIETAKRIGFKNISVDFMYAFQTQTVHEVQKDLEKFLTLDVPHISTYALIIEPHTKLYINKTEEIEEDLERDMYDTICSTLKNKQYNHYEISNFGKNGYASKHNLVYWNNERYYGFGVGASGYLGSIRYDNTRSITEYNKGNINKENNLLNTQNVMENEFMLGFRKLNGISKEKFYKKYHLSLPKIPVIKEALHQNKLIENKTHVYIHPKYIYVMNEILIDFIDREEECYEYDNV